MILQEIESSYAVNDIGEIIYKTILDLKPKKVVEFGVLNGYSTIHIAKALKQLGEGHLYAYDLWEKYQFKKSSMSQALSNLKKYKLEDYVTLGQKDINDWLKEDESFDLVHVDISNDGEKIQHIYDTLKNNKNCKNSIMLFEGGTKQRDEVEWMKLYKKNKIYPLRLSGKVPYEIIEKNYPGLSLVKV